MKGQRRLTRVDDTECAALARPTSTVTAPACSTTLLPLSVPPLFRSSGTLCPMDQQELEQYEHQCVVLPRIQSVVARPLMLRAAPFLRPVCRLAQVEVALGADPSNAELASLQSELKELIDLTKQAIAIATSAGPSKPKTAPAAARPPPLAEAAASIDGARATPEGSASPSTAPRAAEAPSTAAAGLTTDASKYKPGDQVMAKYADGRFYAAKIISQTGPSANPIYTVSYLEYASSPPSTVPLSSLRLMAEAQKRKAEKSADEREKEKKKAKSEKWKEIKDGKNQVQVAKQQGWQSFAKKATKKGLVGVKSESMFKTPDAVNSKGAFLSPLALPLHIG